MDVAVGVGVPAASAPPPTPPLVFLPASGTGSANIPPVRGAEDGRWTPLYVDAGASKRWNIDVGSILREVAARHAERQILPAVDAGASRGHLCSWSLVEWFDGRITRSGAQEVALLVEPRCAPARPERRRFVVATSHAAAVATGAVLVGDQIVLDVGVPSAALGAVGVDVDGDGRLEVVLDGRAAPGGSVRLVRADVDGLHVLHDFGRIGRGCKNPTGTLLLSFRRVPGGVELRDDSRACEP